MGRSSVSSTSAREVTRRPPNVKVMPQVTAYPTNGGVSSGSAQLDLGGVTPRAEVLDTEDRTIPGLLAAGELVGGLFYENYPGGTGLMAGAAFGRLAGEQAAAYVARSR